MRTEVFVTTGGVYVDRNEALRAMIAAIYDTAKAQPNFTTDDVFANVRTFVAADALRAATAKSKLIAVALRKAAKKGICTLSHEQVKRGDETCHNRVKGVWVSNIHAA